ncbi:hypothetical protein Y1Q_0021427 [Alligator mississippiensis]|uniref:Uncharacterized protein n=1 Tax=Alligator mississippiensis TaxID=8496 RepID=A0A151P9Q8_ALLMI|nr:hypothetical protein Y1Q_0021427 [Alligator mississippiensis]
MAKFCWFQPQADKPKYHEADFPEEFPSELEAESTIISEEQCGACDGAKFLITAPRVLKSLDKTVLKTF